MTIVYCFYYLPISYITATKLDIQKLSTVFQVLQIKEKSRNTKHQMVGSKDAKRIFSFSLYH